jgi:predicted Zn finger-like uncharacterized protein
MKVECPNCGTIHHINESKIPDTGAYGKCRECKSRFFVNKKQTSEGINGKNFQNEKSMEKCPNCHYERSLNDKTCPRCGIIYAKFKAPMATPPKKKSIGEKMKRCTFCGEEILDIAKKCKHCGSNIEGDIERGGNIEPEADYGLFLLAIPAVATMLIWFWVSGMNLLQSPGSTMALILIATILGTAIVAAMEASKVKMKSDRKKGSYSPTAWFFIISFIWLIGYPSYLFKRRQYGLRNLIVSGILIAFIFIGSFVTMSTAIEAKKAEIRSDIEELQRSLNR